MENLRNEAPEVSKAFFDLINAIDKKSPLDFKTKELILIGVFASQNALRGIETHVRRAIGHGANKDEIISAIIYTLPVIGISSVTMALAKALEILNETK